MNNIHLIRSSPIPWKRLNTLKDSTTGLGDMNRLYLAWQTSRSKDGTPVNADNDGNGRISILEAFNSAFNQDSYNPGGTFYVQHDSNGDGILDNGWQENPQNNNLNLAQVTYL